MDKNNLGFTGIALIASFLTLLAYAGYLSYKSIDWDVLKRLESQKLVLPTPLPPSSVTPAATATTQATER